MPLIIPTRFYQPRGAFDPAGGGGGSLAYSYRGSFNDFNQNPTTSIDIGTAAADRRIIVAVCGQDSSMGVVSVVVNGVTLTQRVFDNTSATAGIYDGIVASGSGSQTVTVSWDVGSFLDRDFYVWAATGLATGYVSSGTHQGSGTGSANVTAGDFLFAVERQTNPSGNFSGSTEAPSGTRTVGSQSNSADWTIASTNAAFVVDSGGSNKQNLAFAVYR